MQLSVQHSPIAHLFTTSYILPTSRELQLIMQTSTLFPSVMQAERLRIAAEKNIRSEIRRHNAHLRRLLGHIAVLGSLDGLQSPQVPPFYNAAVSASTTIPTSSRNATPEADEVPALEDSEYFENDGAESEESDGDEWLDDDEVYFDDESDTEHALMRMPSHPPIFPRQQDTDSTCKSTQSSAFDDSHWARPASEVVSKAGCGLATMATVTVQSISVR